MLELVHAAYQLGELDIDVEPTWESEFIDRTDIKDVLNLGTLSLPK